MTYTKFYFQNFKGIKDIDINIANSDRPLALVGLNESGKTTILEGIHLIGKHIEHITEEWKLDNGALQPIIPRRIQGFSENIKLGCVIQDGQDTIDISFNYETYDSIFKNFSILVKKNNDPADDTRKKKLLEKLQKQAPSIWYYPDFKFQIPDTINFITSQHKQSQEKETGDKIDKLAAYQRYIANDNNLEWQSILNDIYLYSNSDKQYKKELFQEEVVDYLHSNPQGARAYESKLSNMSNVLSALTVLSWKKISNKDLIKEALLAEQENSIGQLNDYRTYHIMIKETDRTPYEVKERSLGFRWFLSFMLHTEIRQKREANALFLLDEPASNLHAAAQEQILKAINTLAKKTTVIYSTHSPYLLDISNFDTIHIIKNQKKQKMSKITCESLNHNFMQEKEQEYILPVIHHLCFKIPEMLREYDLEQRNPVEQNTSHKKDKVINFLSENLNIDETKLKQILMYVRGAYTSSQITDYLGSLIRSLVP